LFPFADDGTNSTNAVTPAAPTPLSTAELVNADRNADFRRRTGADTETGTDAGAATGAEPAAD